VYINYDSIAAFYDAYVQTDYDVAFFKEEAGRVAGPVLELASGTGRLSLPLIEAVVDLTCVDISQGMLDILRQKLEKRGLHAVIHHADICRLDLPERYESAILPFQSFMEIVGEERQRAALASIFACLLPGGRFICTLHNPHLRIKNVDGLLRFVGHFPFDDGTLVVSGVEQGGRPVVSRLQFFELYGPDGQLVWKWLLPMEFELISPERFEVMANEAGFSIAQVYGNYDRTKFDPAVSPFMIYMLEKPA
jgi:ubiquinone/menaquinone biosynthesis C-methylase UbiE